MDFQKLDDAIQKAESELKNIRSRGDVNVVEFFELIPEFLNEWASYLVKKTIESNPIGVNKLGIERVSILKKKISEYIQSLPELTKKHIDAIKWPHQVDLSNEELKNIYSSDLERNISAIMDNVLRTIIGHLGEMLVEFGLAKIDQYSEWKESNGRICYAYGIPDQYGVAKGPQLKVLKEKYRGILDLYVKALKDFKKAEEDKKIAEAKSLWAQA